MRLLPLALLCLLGLAAPGQAVADDCIVEGPALAERARAREHVGALRAEGLRPRLERRWHHDLGWRWHVIVAGPVDDASASRIAHRATRATGQSHAVLVSTSGESGGAGSAPGPSGDLLARARAVHGPRGLSDRVADADTVRFVFERSTPDGTVVHHYHRDGDHRSLLLEAPGSEPVLMRLDGAAAWVRRGEGPERPADRLRTHEVIARFAPERVLDAALVLPDALVERRELRLAIPVEQGTADRARYRFEGDEQAGPAQIELDPRTGRVLRLELGQGESALVRELSAEILDPRLPVPETLRTRRGATVLDEVRVRVLDLGADAAEGAENAAGT